jgi:hypothetical protein
MRTEQINNSSRKASTQILRELSVEEAMELRPADHQSVAVILNVPFDRDEKGNVLKMPEMLVIKEWQDYGGGYELKKLPAGSMNYEDKNVLAAGTRELFSETGYVAQKGWIISKAVETTSTRQNERHYKIFLVGRDAKEVGKPTESCIRDVMRIPIDQIDSRENMQAYDQRIGLRASVEQMKLFTPEFWYGLEKVRIQEWIPKTQY